MCIRDRDSRVDLTNIQKLHYLHTSLKGEALEIIKNLPITNENYHVALDLSLIHI